MKAGQLHRVSKVDLDTVADWCQSLKLVYPAECLAELAEKASREALSPAGSQASPAVYTLGRTEEFHIRPITLELADARDG